MIRVAFVAAGLAAAVAARRAADPWPGATSVVAAGVFVAVVATVLTLDRVLVTTTAGTARVSGTPGVAADPVIAGPASVRRTPSARVPAAARAAHARRALAWGLLAAAAMSVAPLLEHVREPRGALPPADLPRWALVVAAVAVAQEVLIRGRLWDAVADLAGPGVALVVTAVVFAAIHVPFYGFSVLGVDLAAGIVFGGMRLVTGGLLAPITAHVGADLAGWWIA